MKYVFFLFTLFIACDGSQKQTKEPHMRLLWSYDTEHSSAPKAEPLLDNNTIYVVGGLAMHKVSNSDGSRIWYSPTDGVASSLQNYRFIHNENTIISLEPKRIFGFNKENGVQSWVVQIPDSLELYSIGMGEQYDNIAYYNTVLGHLFKIDISTGDFEIMQKFPFRVRNINVFENGDLLIPHGRGTQEDVGEAIMGRWNPNTKEWVWRYFLPGPRRFSYRYPLIDNNVVYSGLMGGGGFVAINGTTGEEIWKLIDDDLVSSFHVLTPDTIFTSAISFLYALDRHTGQLLWESENIGTSESIRIHYKNGYVYWGHANGIFIFDAKTGKQVHYQRHEYGGYIWTSTMAEDRLLVQTSTHLLAYELFNPEE